MVVTRFCPTPSGWLHQGNLYLAILNQEFARRHGGRCEVQIDDLASPFPADEIIEAILDDLEWLGVCSRKQVMTHSRNKDIYVRMLDELEAQGWVQISRTVMGCCLAQVNISEQDQPVPIKAVHSSRCPEGVAGWLPFASDPRHLLAGSGVNVISGALGWRHDSFWCSDPKDPEPWLEFDLAQPGAPDTIELSWWEPLPLEVEVAVRGAGAAWRSVKQVQRPPERCPGHHHGWFIPRPYVGPEVVALDPAATRGSSQVRLTFRGMQPIENYEMTAPPAPEIIPYADLCNGKRTAERTFAMELRMFQFGRSASDIVLGATHVIRGDELMDELDLYVQCLHPLHHPIPVLCHVPRLVDAQGVKLSKTDGNAPRLVPELQAAGLNPQEARRWIIEQAYRTVKNPTPMHDFEGQMALLEKTID